MYSKVYGKILCIGCSQNYVDCGECSKTYKKTEMKEVEEAASDNDYRCPKCYAEILKKEQEAKLAEEEKEAQAEAQREAQRKNCQQCQKKLTGRNWQEIHIIIGDIYAIQEGKYKKRILCLNC